MPLTHQELTGFAVQLAASRERWSRWVRHPSDARVYEQIWNQPEVNAWVICWSEDQDTGYHDHDDSAAAIVVVSGQVREDRLRMGAPPASRVIGAGSSFVVPPVAIHRVLHEGQVPAVTIHAYSPPLTKVGAYRFSSSGELERESLSYETELRAAPVAA